MFEKVVVRRKTHLYAQVYFDTSISAQPLKTKHVYGARAQYKQLFKYISPTIVDIISVKTILRNILKNVTRSRDIMVDQQESLGSTLVAPDPCVECLFWSVNICAIVSTEIPITPFQNTESLRHISGV